MKYQIGRLLQFAGVRVIRDYKASDGNLNLLQLGLRYIAAIKPSVNVVQVGAFDGELCDPLHGMLALENLKVLFVEPQESPFKNLQALYSSRPNTFFENSAITERDGQAQMFIPAGETASPKASLERNHMRRFGIRAEVATSVKVNCICVDSLLRRYQIKHVDVLLIDTEGCDFKILMQFFDCGITPSIVNLELLHLSKKERIELRKQFSDRGYRYQDHGFDTFAINSRQLWCES
jgi:FkbM family methyltransferase